MRKRVAFIFHVFNDKNFQSGGEKINFYIIKALYELGCEIDVYCNHNYAGHSRYVKNIYDGDCSARLFGKEKDYTFTFSQNGTLKTDFIYMHENTRFYRNNVIRKPFENLMKQIFSHKRLMLQNQTIEIEREILNSAKKIVIPSSFLKEDLKMSYNIDDEKICIIPPCVDENINDFQKKNNGVFTFGLTARSFADKGGYEFLLATVILKLSGVKLKTKIIYPFSLSSNRLKKLINILGLKDTIEIMDYCENMNNFYSGLDCLVLASKRESFGLVAIEAVARKIPLIINDYCGVKDFIIHQKNGFVYERNRPCLNLIRTMKYVITHREELPAITENAMAILDELSFEKFKNKFATLLKEYE